jgi:hypothetical protein
VRSFSEKSLDDSLSFSALISGIPPSLDGTGSLISCAFSIFGVIIKLIINTAVKLINAFLIAYDICG